MTVREKKFGHARLAVSPQRLQEILSPGPLQTYQPIVAQDVIVSAYAEVLRYPSVDKGPGVFLLWVDYGSGFVCVGTWQCWTGGSQLDAKAYGGLTPPICWQMIQPIHNFAINPGKFSMRQAIIVPRDTGKAGYPNRTFYNLDGDPFRIHPAGTSTGCIIIEASVFDHFMDTVNAVYALCAFPIYVRDIASPLNLTA